MCKYSNYVCANINSTCPHLRCTLVIPKLIIEKHYYSPSNFKSHIFIWFRLRFFYYFKFIIFLWWHRGLVLYHTPSGKRPMLSNMIPPMRTLITNKFKTTDIIQRKTFTMWQKYYVAILKCNQKCFVLCKLTRIKNTWCMWGIMISNLSTPEAFVCLFALLNPQQPIM